MSEAPPQISPAERFQSLVRRRDAAVGQASELGNSVAEAQAVRFQTTVLRLMHRSGDNPELVAALVGFLGNLEHAAGFGDPSQSLSADRVRWIADSVNKAAEVVSPRSYK